MSLIEFLIYSDELGITAIFTDRQQIYPVSPRAYSTLPADWHRAALGLQSRLLRCLMRLPKHLVEQAKNNQPNTYI